MIDETETHGRKAARFPPRLLRVQRARRAV